MLFGLCMVLNFVTAEITEKSDVIRVLMSCVSCVFLTYDLFWQEERDNKGLFCLWYDKNKRQQERKTSIIISNIF